MNLNRELDKLLFGVEDKDLKLLPVSQTPNNLGTVSAVYLTELHYSNGVLCRDYFNNAADSNLLVIKMLELGYTLQTRKKEIGYETYFTKDLALPLVGTTLPILTASIAQAAYNVLTF